MSPTPFRDAISQGKPVAGRTMLSALTAVVLVLVLGVGPAGAQFFRFPFFSQPQAPPQPQPERPRAKSPKVEPPTEVTPEVTTPYDPDLERLADILGALHFLRRICGYGEGPKWRAEAQALIDAEAPTGKRHDEMVQSFNRGYAGFQQTYRTCTPSARVVVRRYLEEGARIARDLTARYAD
jgi:uncharacterized protein (TIGR02301 family)